MVCSEREIEGSGKMLWGKYSVKSDGVQEVGGESGLLPPTPMGCTIFCEDCQAGPVRGGRLQIPAANL